MVGLSVFTATCHIDSAPPTVSKRDLIVQLLRSSSVYSMIKNTFTVQSEGK